MANARKPEDTRRMVSIPEDTFVACIAVLHTVRKALGRKISDSRSEVLRHWFGSLLNDLDAVEDGLLFSAMEDGFTLEQCAVLILTLGEDAKKQKGVQ